MAVNIFHHDDGIVDHEADRDGQGHQRQIVQAEAEEIHGRGGAEERERNRDGRNQGGPEITQEQEDHQDDQSYSQCEREFDIAHRGPDGLRPINDRVEFDPRRHDRGERRHRRLDPIHRIDDVGAGLLEHEKDHGRLGAAKRRDIDVLRPCHSVAHVAHAHRRPIAIGNDDIVVVFRLGDLIVRGNRETLLRSIDAALGRVGGGDPEHGTHVLECQTARLQLGRIDLDANGGLLLATDGDLRHAGDLRNLLRHHRVGEIVDGRERKRVRMRSEDQDRGIGRVHLAISRRCRKRNRKLAGGCRNGGLHILSGGVHIAVEVELQRDGGGAEHAGRSDLGDAGNLAESALERRGDRCRHGVGAGTRQ